MNRVKYTTTTTGTGNLTLSLETGFQAAASAPVYNMSDSRLHYFILDANGTDWEYGLASISGTALTRQTVLESTNAGAAVSLSAGTHTVFIHKGGVEGLILTCAIQDATPAAISANTAADVASGTLQFDTVLQDDLAALPAAWVVDTTADEVTTPISEWQYPLQNGATGLLKGWRAHFLVKVPSTATAGNVGIEIGTYFGTPIAAAWAPFINGRANTVSCSTPWIEKPEPDGTSWPQSVDHISPLVYNDSAASLTLSRCELWVEFRI